MNSLGTIAKFFQSVEVLINLALVNSHLGGVMESVLEILRSLKFPLKIPKDFFWSDYQAEADVLFWKYRAQVSTHEKEMFILCNETLMVIMYLLSWILWLLAIAFKRCSFARKKKNQIDLMNSDKITEKKKEIKSGIVDSANDKHKTRLNFQQEDEESHFNSQSNANIQKEGNKKVKLNSESLSERSEPLSQRPLIASSLADERKKAPKRGNNQNVVRKGLGGEELDNQLQTAEERIDRIVVFFENLKMFFFSFSSFDVQFITFNELLHSDVTLMDGFGSKGAISYLISLFTLFLMIYDIRWFFWSSVKIYHKVKNKIELTQKEKEVGKFLFEDVEMRPEVSFTAMNLNLFSMMRFSIYQLFILSLQLAPQIQTGSLVTFQALFLGFYIKKYRNDKFFENSLTLIKFLVFEVSIFVFLLISFIFSFESAKDRIGSTSTAWLQMSAASMMLISILVEFITLVTKAILNALKSLKAICSKKNPPNQTNSIGVEANNHPKKQKEENNNNKNGSKSNSNKKESKLIQKSQDEDFRTDSIHDRWNFEDLRRAGGAEKPTPRDDLAMDGLQSGTRLRNLIGSHQKIYRQVKVKSRKMIKQEKARNGLKAKQKSKNIKIVDERKKNNSSKKVRGSEQEDRFEEKVKIQPKEQEDSDSLDFSGFLKNENEQKSKESERDDQMFNTNFNNIDEMLKGQDEHKHSSININALNQRIEGSSQRNISAFTPHSLKKLGKFTKSKLKARSRLKGKLLEKAPSPDYLDLGTPDLLSGHGKTLSRFKESFKSQFSTKTVPIQNPPKNTDKALRRQNNDPREGKVKNSSKFKIGSKSKFKKNKKRQKNPPGEEFYFSAQDSNNSNLNLF